MGTINYDKLSEGERAVYDVLGEHTTLLLMKHCFANACIKAEILGIKSGDSRFILLQEVYRAAIFDIFANQARKLDKPEEYVFYGIDEEVMRDVEMRRTHEENSKLLEILNRHT